MTAIEENAIDLLKNKIREMMNDTTDAMAQGGCTDFAAYSHQCGVIQGLALAERELLDLKGRYEDF